MLSPILSTESVFLYFVVGCITSVCRSSLGLKSILEDAGTRTRDLSTKHAKRVR